MAVIAALACAACSETAVTPDLAPREAGADQISRTSAIDILLVVDTSPSMAEEQLMWSWSFPRWDSCLTLPGGEPLDFRLGFITADLGAFGGGPPTCTATGDGAKLQTGPQVTGCPSSTPPWITPEGAKAIPGCSASCVNQAIACVAPKSCHGCLYSQPLEAARRALDPVKNLNPGFVRPDAHLAIVFITDEDDCSAARPELLSTPDSQDLGPADTFRCFEHGVQCAGTPARPTSCKPAGDWLHPVADYEAFFRKLKPQHHVIIGAVAAPTEPVEIGDAGGQAALRPSCQSGAGRGTPPIRLRALVDRFGPLGFAGSICTAGKGDDMIYRALYGVRTVWDSVIAPQG